MRNKSVENFIYRVYKKDLLKALEDKIERVKKHVENFPDSFDYCVEIKKNIFSLAGDGSYISHKSDISYRAPNQKDIDKLLDPDTHIIYDGVNDCYMREVT